MATNSFSAHALLAKIYFQTNQLDLAINETNEVINSGIYALDNDSLFIHRFREQLSQEAIFTIVSTSNFDNRSGQFTGSYRSDINANPTLRASEELFDLVNIFGEEDKRASWFELKKCRCRK